MNVTPGAVSQWEGNEVLGRAQLATIQRALRAMGADTRVTATGDYLGRPERREDRVSLELHRAVAQKLIANPAAVLAVVPDNARRIRQHIQGEALLAGLDEWVELSTTGDIPGLVAIMLGTDSRSASLRQIAPFMGVLDQNERAAAIERAAA